MDAKTPQLAVKLSSAEAKAYLDRVNAKVVRRWEERVTHSEFMKELVTGKLPVPVIRLFFQNWGAFTIEINTLIAASYHKHLGFFKRHTDLLGPFGAKIADEFIHPKPPGHVLVM